MHLFNLSSLVFNFFKSLIFNFKLESKNFVNVLQKRLNRKAKLE